MSFQCSAYREFSEVNEDCASTDMDILNLGKFLQY